MVGFSDEQIYWKDLINSSEFGIITTYSTIKLVLYLKIIATYCSLLKT